MIETWKNDFRAFVNSLNLSRDDYKTMMEYIEKIPAAQPDHNADIGKKVSISCGHENNDVIFRKMAIEALARMMPHSYTPDGSHPADEEIFRAQEVFADCIEALEILPSAQPEQRWIPCSEKLPEYNESVLTWDGYVFCIEKRIPYIRDDDGEPIEGDWWVSDEYDEYESECYPNLRDGAAIAWMPLPEPYR